MRTLITPNSKPLAAETVAQMIADFKLRNPHLCDDVEDASPIGHGELRSDRGTENR
jgi:hypothetical protein